MDLKRHKSQIYHALVRTGGDCRSVQKFIFGHRTEDTMSAMDFTKLGMAVPASS